MGWGLDLPAILQWPHLFFFHSLACTFPSSYSNPVVSMGFVDQHIGCVALPEILCNSNLIHVCQNVTVEKVIV